MHWGTPSSAFSRFGSIGQDPYNDGGQQIEGPGNGSFGGPSPISSAPRGGYGGMGRGVGPGGFENDNPAAIADIQSTRGTSGEFHSGSPLHYAQGGAIDEATGAVNTGMGGGMGDFGARLQSGAKLAQEMLNHTRQKFGIGGQQEAANRIPVSPGTQSESGMPKTQPMPGPLPPTNNPFGKRAEADPDQDGDTAAIDTDDDQEQA